MRDALAAGTNYDSEEIESGRTTSIEGEVLGIIQQDVSGNKEGLEDSMMEPKLELMNKNEWKTWTYIINA